MRVFLTYPPRVPSSFPLLASWAISFDSLFPDSPLSALNSIQVSSVTDHVGVQDAGAKTADFDDDDGGGLVS